MAKKNVKNEKVKNSVEVYVARKQKERLTKEKKEETKENEK